MRSSNQQCFHSKCRCCNVKIWRGVSSSRVTVRASQSGLPSKVEEVLPWAKRQFMQEVAFKKPDSSIHLAKVCMLLALEEEAAHQLAAQHPEVPSPGRTSATASTWSLQRLDALAAEVVDFLVDLERGSTQLQDMQTARNPSSSSSSGGQSPREHPKGDTHWSATMQSSTASTGQSNHGAEQDQPDQHQEEQASLGAEQTSAAAAFAAVRQQAQQYPMQVLNAVNAVVFQRHGYSACNRFGASVDSQLSSVLEDGPGSVVALTILYMEVCSRLGLYCGVKVVEEGRYCLVWPLQQQQVAKHAKQQQQQEQQAAHVPDVEQASHTPPLLSVGGDACVIDVYGEGALLPIREATELFGITQQELLAGSSRRELLSSLLLELQRAHWCAAVGCSPTPALMTPLTAGTAVQQAVRQLHGASIERAAAAAAKRVVLTPWEPQPQLDLALLSYFSGRYEDAWLELGSYLERLTAAQQQQQHQVRSCHATEAVPAAGLPDISGHTSSGAGAVAASSTEKGAGASSRSSVSKVTELHAAIQSMLMGGAIVPEAPLSAVNPTVAEAALASADEDVADSEAEQQQQQELKDLMLLFQKLQLELMLMGDKATQTGL